MELGTGRKGVVPLCRFLTHLEMLLGKQQFPLSLQLNLNQTRQILSHTYTGPGEILNWWSQTGQNQKEQVSGGGTMLPDFCAVFAVVVAVFPKICPLEV